MTMTISRVYLFNVERGEPEEAELWDEITEQQLADWEGEWVPELFKAMQRLRRAGIERRHWPQSRYWNWRKKTETFQEMLAFPGFSIVCDGLTQGILIRAAIALSEDLEFYGRIGLHSLPQANGFYANTCGMTDLGADPDYEGLRYFEMTPEQARAFNTKGDHTT